ncbi:MAG: ribosome silencing factor [Candidatus Pacebacteria bacterium]|nr:ribosome silencing factor [Candidatus Paceibacterota bacterium]
MAKAIEEALDSKKGEDIKIIKIDRKTAIADYFVLCSGSSTTHVQALAKELERLITERDLSPAHIEGRDNNSWILLDYSNVVVHIFSYEAREFYKLERLYTENEKNNTEI